jgi:hypothetical protein
LNSKKKQELFGKKLIFLTSLSSLKLNFNHRQTAYNTSIINQNIYKYANKIAVKNNFKLQNFFGGGDSKDIDFILIL